MDTSRKLKQLQVQHTQAQRDIKTAKDKIQADQAELSCSKAKLHALEQEMQKLSDTKLVVSEHAVLRYAERIMGLDVEQIKEQILNPKTAKRIQELRNGAFPDVAPNDIAYKLHVRNGVVTTVIAKDS